MFFDVPKIKLEKLYLLLYLKTDPWESGCPVAGETCKLVKAGYKRLGVCNCGTGDSCYQNYGAPTCDAENSQCICGTPGVSSKGCPTNEYCVTDSTLDQHCSCGTANPKGCEGSSDGNVYCDSKNDHDSKNDQCVSGS